MQALCDPLRDVGQHIEPQGLCVSPVAVHPLLSQGVEQRDEHPQPITVRPRPQNVDGRPQIVVEDVGPEAVLDQSLDSQSFTWTSVRG